MITRKNRNPFSRVWAFTLVLCLGALYAPLSFAVWPAGGGSALRDQATDIKVGPSGDVYAIGHFQGSADIGGLILNSADSLDDLYVVRLSPGGSVIWAASAGGTSSILPASLAIDESENVYVAGAFYGRASFGGLVIDSGAIPSTSGRTDTTDAFVAKLNSDGVWQWAKDFGSHNDDFASSVTTVPGDNSQIPPVPGSILVTGGFRCFLDYLDPNGTKVVVSGSCNVSGEQVFQDMFVARLDTQGDVQYVRRRPGASGIENITHAEVSPVDGRLFITGDYASVTGGRTLSSYSFNGSAPGWSSTNSSRTGFSTVQGRNSLFLRGGFVTFTSPVRDLANEATVEISYTVMRGGNFAGSELPDRNEDMLAEFLDSGGQWRTIDRFFGGFAGGEVFNFTRRLPASALHSNFRIRFRHLNGSGSYIGGFFDYWHIDNLELRGFGADRKYLSSVTNTLGDGSNLTFNSFVNLPVELTVNDLELSPNLQTLALAANVDAAVTYCVSSLPVGGAIAGFNASTLLCDWIKQVPDGSVAGVSTAPIGASTNEFNVYATGRMTGDTTFFAGPDGTLSTADSGANCGDIYVASLIGSSAGSWEWVTGGGGYDATDAVPGRAGGPLCDEGIAVANDGVQGLYVTGNFQDNALFGEDQSILSFGDDDIFVGNLARTGVWFDIQTFTVGVPVVAPAGAETGDVIFVPKFFVDGEEVAAIAENLFYWQGPVNGAPAQLIPLQETPLIEIFWYEEGSSFQDQRFLPAQTGLTVWPTSACSDASFADCYQVHVAQAPVEIEPADDSFTFLQLVKPNGRENDGAVNSGVFTANTSGFSSMLFVQGPEPDPSVYPAVVQVVRTLPFAAAPRFESNVPWEIGRKIVDPYHNENGRTGLVLSTTAMVDAAGANAAYNRAGRTGTIIPVNRILTARPQDATKQIVVTWYRRKAMNTFWPEKPVDYEPFWPLDPDLIVIASERGGEAFGQAPLEPQDFQLLSIYNQPDPAVAGYNPNDEHAFFAPSSTGTGLEAIFALRSDFGSELDNDLNAASDPYVLIKYFNPASNEWNFRVYKTLGTGAGFNSFRFDGVAGTTVAPPYPVSLLPGCPETSVVGQGALDPQPPPPFFKDYKNQLWAASAGSGSVRYHYPAQAGFFTDLDNNDINDIGAGTCVAWLPRLPASQGGTDNPNRSIVVNYDVVWPDTAPQLIPGETLLTPKRGLPDIFNQAAVQIAFDELRDSTATPDPANALVQLIDPLNPRTVALAALPAGVASELASDGKRIILGNAAGTTKLPVSVRDRLRFDSQNGRLMFAGVFDESGAGEPLLLLNVLSKRDRDLLLAIDDSGDAAWANAIQDLFLLTRNPQNIEGICTNSSLNEQEVRICNASNPVTDDDVLIGQQDVNSDTVLEQFQAVGVKPALTAGFAQGNGFVTLVFNNDATLNPLPVSLNVIKVECLQSPPPPVLPGDADVFASYQGQLQIISPENIFDEQLVLRHSGDFGGNPDGLEFEWFFHPDIDGTPPMPLPDPAAGQLNGWIQFPVDDPSGAVEISIEGANIQTLSDNWYVARYRGLNACNNASEWSLFAGQPGATPLDVRAQLAEGWVKRVLKRLNPFEARVQDFAKAATNNYTSMLVQLGERYEGDIALNNDPDNLNNFGLIEAYTTVMRRAINLSAGATPPVDYGPANAAILLVASRLVDFYTLLGNEAYGDSQDPTVGIDVGGDATTVSLAPTIFNFQNQLASLLEEELVLMRGRDTANGPVAASPVYNRLFWNFTTGEGEVAYALSYNISDTNSSGVIDEFDARILYPQGHGDAWGHYLTALDIYYDLLRHPFFSWDNRAEAITVAGVPLSVDFLDERQFAETAAAKARTGAEIVDLTYRLNYVEDPSGQWQGYKDRDAERAWGLSEWGKRGGQGAYLDWVTGNAIVQVEEPDPDKRGIQRVDRTTVSELDEIQTMHAAIQNQVDEADQGLNPLGLAQGVVPFDIDPSLVDRGQTHFEQVFARAGTAIDNAVQVWTHANNLNNMLRLNQNEVEDLSADAASTEFDFNARLIEIFGYPYADDIGPGGLYPAGYDGPDLYHYQYVDVNALEGTAFDLDGCPPDDASCTPNSLLPAKLTRFSGSYLPVANGVNFFNITGENLDLGCGSAPLGDGCSLGSIKTGPDDVLTVEYTTLESDLVGFAFTKPPEWTGVRRAPGKLQEILSEMLSARIALDRAFNEYEGLRGDVNDQIDTIQATFNIRQEQINVANAERRELNQLTITTEIFKNSAIVARRAGAIIDDGFKVAEGCVPESTVFGFSNGGDLLSPVSCTLTGGGLAASAIADAIGDGLEIVSNATDAAKEDVSLQAAIETTIQDNRLELFGLKGDLDGLLSKEPLIRAEIYSRAQTMLDLRGKYYAALAEGQRTLQQLVSFRKTGAAAVQEYRYEDMAFRIFRNDALQKYRAAFDLAARYTFLAATAYDYETNLLGDDAQAGRGFLTQIVRERSLGQILDGEPVPGSPGLADPMGRMAANFEVLKGRMGFNNPQTETNRFSLRRELYRIAGSDPDANADWRTILEDARVDNLWEIPEFRRFARPFAPESAGPQSGLVIRFPSTVSFGLNYFGNELGPGDSAYDSSQFATKIRGAGVWLADYDGLPLSNTPRVYLFPVGADVLRAPSGDNFAVREWSVVDQAIPVPFELGSQDLDNPNWLPSDTLIGTSAELRRFSRFRAYHFTEPFDDSEIISDSRLIGRSVWNREWMMVIPGETLLFDTEEGLDTLIHGELVPGGGGQRDGNGISDILLFFKTYAYSGN